MIDEAKLAELERFNQIPKPTTYAQTTPVGTDTYLDLLSTTRALWKVARAAMSFADQCHTGQQPPPWSEVRKLKEALAALEVMQNPSIGIDTLQPPCVWCTAQSGNSEVTRPAHLCPRCGYTWSQ